MKLWRLSRHLPGSASIDELALTAGSRCFIDPFASFSHLLLNYNPVDDLIVSVTVMVDQIGSNMARKRAEIVQHWDSTEKRTAAHGIIEKMIEGDLKGAEAIHPRAEGRWAISGFDFGVRKHERPFQYFTPNGVDVPPGVARGAPNLYQNLIIEDANFSESLFYDSYWLDCTFRKCLFDRADLYGSHFRGCMFNDVRFDDCWIENNALGLSSEKNLGLFFDVEFVKGIFSRVSFGFPRFERCRFACPIKHTNFHGSQFEECSFEGRLDVVQFNRRPEPLPKVEDFVLLSDVPPNEMKRIDFSRASFQRIAFDDCLDLRDCTLPKKQRAFLVKNSSLTLGRVMVIIENEWDRDDKEQALHEAVFLLRSKSGCSVDQSVVVPTELEKKYGSEFAQRLVTIIKQAMEEEQGQ